MNEEECQAAADAIADMLPERTRWWILRRRIKFWWQRRTRGWDDSETWSLDIPITKFVLPRLRRFRELMNGHPGDMSWEEWQATIDKMIRAFELCEIKYDWEPDEARENADEMQEGLELFGKWFSHLWW